MLVKMCSQWCFVLCVMIMLDCAIGRHWQRHERDHEEGTLLGLQELSAPSSATRASPESTPSAVTIAPLFMQLLLRQTESGPLQATADGDGFRALARSAPPIGVSIDFDGHVVMRFGTAPEPPDVDASVCALVLAFRDRPPDLENADLNVELRDDEGHVLHRAAVPPARAFVSFVVGCVGEEGLRLTASVVGAESPLDGAALVEIGGAQLGPLLVRSRDHILTGGPVRTWPLPADDGGGGSGERIASPNAVDGHQRQRRRRRRRHGSEEDASSEDDPCHLQEWVVSTEDMGWNFVLYPTSISVNLCVGECSSPVLLQRHYNATTHAIARDVYRRLSTRDDVRRVSSAKCVPIQYRKLALLIERSPGSYSLETNSDLSASRCGCR